MTVLFYYCLHFLQIIMVISILMLPNRNHRLKQKYKEAIPVARHGVHMYCLLLLCGRTLYFHSQLNLYACHKHRTSLHYIIH